jgi:hypothetical protein
VEVGVLAPLSKYPGRHEKVATHPDGYMPLTAVQSVGVAALVGVLGREQVVAACDMYRWYLVLLASIIINTTQESNKGSLRFLVV